MTVLFGGCVAIVAGAGQATDQLFAKPDTVVYNVTGSSPTANITYSTLQGGNGEEGGGVVHSAILPWSKATVVSGLFTVFALRATTGSGGGSVTCTIFDDGKKLSSNTATGSLATASCIG
jgi:hypothetical protein